MAKNEKQDPREDFDLTERLLGVGRIEKVVSVYTDKATGKELGGVEDIFVPGTAIKTGEQRRWGVIGEMRDIADRAEQLKALLTETPELEEELTPEIDELVAKRKSLLAKAKKLIKKLQSTSFEFTLVSVPDIVKKDARRQTRKNLGLKAKGIEGHEEDYMDEFGAVMLTLSTVLWVDKKDGTERKSITIEQARALKGYLPDGQFDLLDAAMNELSYEKSISNAATDQVDFS